MAIFYEDNTSVASSHAHIQLDTLRPGEKSGFEMVFEDIVDTGEALEFDSYDLSVESTRTGPKTACLSLSVTENFVDDAGLYHISGTVANSGNQLTDSIKVSATFYNASGHVTAINSIEIADDNEEIVLQPEESATFDLEGTPIADSTISSYSINVESQQYSMINDAITKDNVPCPVQPSTSLTLQIDGMTPSVITEELLVSGTVSLQIEDRRYVNFEIYNVNGQLYHRELCELDNDNSYLCTVTFHPLKEHDFLLVASYAGASTELSFTIPNGNNETTDADIEDSSIGRIHIDSILAMNYGNVQAGNSSISSMPKVIISNNLTNNSTDIQPATIILQIEDSSGTVVFVDFYDILLAPAEETSLSIEWIPDIVGDVIIEVYVWDGLENSSQPLAEVIRNNISLTSIA